MEDVTECSKSFITLGKVFITIEWRGVHYSFICSSAIGDLTIHLEEVCSSNFVLALLYIHFFTCLDEIDECMVTFQRWLEFYRVTAPL